MPPGKLFLVIIGISSAFVSEAQDQAKNISSSTKQLKIEGTIQGPGKTSASFKDYSRPTRSAEPRCSCNVSPQIVPVSRTGTTWTYQGIPNATCSGGIITSPDKAEDTCGVITVTYSWNIVSGNAVAEISGSNTGSSVNINITGNGSFTLNLVNGVTCSDSSSCSYYAYYTDTAHVDSSQCVCTAGPVTIQPTNRQGNTWTYQGSVQGNCTGQYGIPPNLNSCGVQNTLYQWSISGLGASIQGNSSGQSVNVQVSANAKFSLRLDGTTVCSDGKNCTNYNFYEDSVKNDTPRHCQCNVASVKIDPINRQDSTFTYSATVVGSCTGVHGIEPNVDSCAVQTITYDWFISAGTAVAEILGPTNGSTVIVHIKKQGAFTLDVAGDVICSDSSRCHYVTYIEDSLRKNKCELSFDEDLLPKMDGGLRKFFGPKDGRMARDEFIVLEAEGKDIDKVILHCTPASGCLDTKSNRTILLNGHVRYEWKIEGEGNFVKLGCLPDGVKKDEGEHVIFQPPFVPLPTQGNESSVTTTVILSIIDDNPTQPLDVQVDRKITIVTKRFLTSPDDYVVDIKSDPYVLPKPDVPTQDIGSCKAVHAWEMNKDLKIPEVELPGVPDKDKMVAGELIVLKAVDQRDPDKLKMVCQGTNCDNDGNEKVYEDDVQWTWTVLNNNAGNNGRIIGQDKGRFIVYEAPNKLPKDSSFITVTIQVTVENTSAPPKIADEKFTKQIKLLVYQGGIKMEYPPLEWLPTENGSVQVKSSLTYLDGKTWKPSLAHQCRIHFFELKQVSDEPGVCMNEPTPDKADDCRDLYIKNESNHEAYNDTKTGKKCTLAELFQEARSKKPLREYSITIYSRDFGAGGFLLSKTRRNADYLSVPVLATDVTHPDGTRNKKTIYKDNRINLPRDIDENKIADWGWDVSPTLHIPDPIDNKVDDDASPQGDKFPGDGLTNYEEYRGFRVMGGEDFVHIRTSILHKDLFVRNRDVLKLDLFKAQSGLQVHEITPEQYVNDATRIVNFNKSGDVHLIDQLGLFLLSAPDDGNLLGKADTQDGQPAPPNGVVRVRVMVGRIRKFCKDRNMNAADEQSKIEQVTAHELAHACNVYHHGDGDPAVEGTFNTIHGLRSGNMSCIMRYDNLESTHLESIGNIFCISATATSSNPFGDANTTLCRGNCAGQFRISSRGKVPKRLTAQQCRQNNQ